MKHYQKSLFIFRRDLRLVDNTALNVALAQPRQVLACFIFDPRQTEPHPYQSEPALQFMLQALQDLQRQIAGRGGVLHLIRMCSDMPFTGASMRYAGRTTKAGFAPGVTAGPAFR